MTFSQARRQLKSRLSARYTQRQMAQDIGCGEDHLSHVFAGRKSFGLLYANAIEKRFRIPATAWETRRPRKAS